MITASRNASEKRFHVYRKIMRPDLLNTLRSVLGLWERCTHQKNACITKTVKGNPIQHNVYLRDLDIDSTYRMVLSVRRRIHWGMGRFCFCFFAKCFLILNVFWEGCPPRKKHKVFKSEKPENLTNWMTWDILDDCKKNDALKKNTRLLSMPRSRATRAPASVHALARSVPTFEIYKHSQNFEEFNKIAPSEKSPHPAYIMFVTK